MGVGTRTAQLCQEPAWCTDMPAQQAPLPPAPSFYNHGPLSHHSQVCVTPRKALREAHHLGKERGSM